MLWSLVVVPVLIVMYIFAQRRRQRYALRYASLSLVKEALGRGPGIRRHIPPTVFLFSLTVMLVALARPYTQVVVPAEQGTVILAMDVSGSMRADDLKPDRMEAAKAAARSFVEKEPPGVRIGVVSFTDNAFLIQPPTSDREATIAAINRLSPQRGTAIGRGLLTSLDAIFEDANAEGAQPNSDPTPTPTPVPKGTYEPAVIVLLTDGESNQGPRPLDVVEQISARGVRVYTVGIGSVAGTILRVGGRAIRTRLDEETLKQVALATDGTYYNAANENDLRAIYESLSSRLVLTKQQTEVTAIFTGLAVALSLIGGLFSLLWFNRLP
jgi:Ca-activated chloride channel family protein